MSQYIVQPGDTLSRVAAREYGDPALWKKIWQANQTTIKSGNPETIYPGEVLIIPEKTIVKNLPNKGQDDLSIIVDGLELNVINARVLRTMDTCTDAWSCQVPWTPGDDEKFDRATRPYSYAKASAHIGGELIINGMLYTVEPEMTISGMIKTLTGYSFTADAVDSTINSVYERSVVKLEQVANDLVEPIGIDVVVEADTGGTFDMVEAKEQDTIFSHLSRLARQRGVLIGATPQGDMLIHKANTDQDPVGTIEEDQPMSLGWKAKYDGRKRFNTYTSISSDWGASLDWLASDFLDNDTAKNAVAKDNAVPRSRTLTFKADDVTRGNVLTAAEWKRSLQTVEALTLPFEVEGWYAPNGKIWRENTTVTVKSKILGVPNGFTFLIKSVEYILNENGQKTKLGLIPPQVYSGESLGDIWK